MKVIKVIIVIAYVVIDASPRRDRGKAYPRSFMPAKMIRGNNLICHLVETKLSNLYKSFCARAPAPGGLRTI